MANTFSMRFRGLSVFSLAPVSESSLEVGMAARTEMMQYEFIEGQGYVTSADQKALSKIESTWASVPGTRYETVLWVDHLGLMLDMILGSRCPVLPTLDKIYHGLNKLTLVRHWKEREWKLFIWTLHICIREFMGSGDVTRLNHLNHQIRLQLKLNDELLLVELKRPHPISPEQPPSDLPNEKRPASGQPEGNSQNRKRANVATELAAHIKNILAVARTKTTKDLRAGEVFPNDATTDKILGAEYLALVTPADRRPCLRAHVYGRCGSTNCSRAHSLTGKPSRALLDSIATRLQTRLDQIAAEHPK